MNHRRTERRLPVISHSYGFKQCVAMKKQNVVRALLVCALSTGFSFQSSLVLAPRRWIGTNTWNLDLRTTTSQLQVSDPRKGETLLSEAPSSGDAELVARETEEELRFRSATYDLTQAAVVGIATGLGVSLFKLSIEAVRGLFFEREILVNYPWLIAIIPGIGGLIVGAILLLGDLPPGLRGTVAEVDKESSKATERRSTKDSLNLQLKALRKSFAAVMTLGTGCSLGPEGKLKY